jgi:hypothetical protein
MRLMLQRKQGKKGMEMGEWVASNRRNNIQ